GWKQRCPAAFRFKFPPGWPSSPARKTSRRDPDAILRATHRNPARSLHRHGDRASHARAEVRNERPRIDREGMGTASRAPERNAFLPELLPSRTPRLVCSPRLVDRAGRLLPLGTWCESRSILPCAPGYQAGGVLPAAVPDPEADPCPHPAPGWRSTRHLGLRTRGRSLVSPPLYRTPGWNTPHALGEGGNHPRHGLPHCNERGRIRVEVTR